MDQLVEVRLERLEAEMRIMKKELQEHSTVARSNAQELKELKSQNELILEIAQSIQTGMKITSAAGQFVKWGVGMLVAVATGVQAYYFIKTGQPPSITIK